MSRALIPGFRFKEGKLFIFTDAEVMTIDGWPEFAALRREVPRGSPKPFIPPFRLLKPRKSKLTQPGELGPGGISGRTVHAEVERTVAFNGFRYTMPPAAAEACERFPGRQWRVLTLSSMREEAIELINQSPALGFALAHHVTLRAPVQVRSGEVKASILRKHREILEWLGFPGSEAVVRILKKIAPEAVHLDRMKKLREALKQPEVVQLLGHIDQLNAGVQTLVSDPLMLESVTPKLLSEVAACEGELENSEVGNLLGTFQEMWRTLEPQKAVRKFESIAKLRDLHREVSLAYSRKASELAGDAPLPSPPLPGTEEIIPMTTTGELREEGRLQKNCVASYAKWVQTGGCYIYRVLQPQRATLAIARGSDGCWMISELEISANRKAGDPTWDSVNEWLRRYSFSI